MTAPSAAPHAIVATITAGTGQSEHVEAEQRAEVAQREHRADRKVDAADNDDQRHAEHDKADFAGLPSGIGEAADRQKAVDRRG